MSLGALTAALADHYRLDREIGAGGMATVYLAHDIKHDRKVAIKVLRPELAAVIGAERFLSEIKTTANLQHPHILPLFDSGTADNQLFYVMPYVDGETLRERLTRETQLPIADAVRLATEIAAALEYAHKRGIVHRDIKPENVLIQDGSAVVADFGIALAVQQAGGERMTQTGMSLGTPHYMSPEQAMGEKTLDARSDVYALGAVTYEMLIGEPPFTGPSAQAIMAKVMTESPKELTGQRRSVPSHVSAAVRHALEKLPADRFPSAASFAMALNSAGAGYAPAAARGRRIDWRAALVGGALLGGAIAVAIGATARNPATSAIVAQRKQLTFNGRTGQPAISADGGWVAYNDVNCPTARRDSCRTTILVQETGTTQATSIIRDARRVGNARWSHDGSQLVVAAQLDSVRVGLFAVPRGGGVARLIGPAGPHDTHPSGDSVVIIRANPARNATALFVNLATGALVDSIQLPFQYAVDVAWSPDGRWLAMNSADSRVRIIDRTGKETANRAINIRGPLRWNPAGDAVLFFIVGSVREDEFVKLAVDRNGIMAPVPTTLLSRVPTLYAGTFDVARKLGRMIFATGDATTDLWTYQLTPGSLVAQQRTRGTTWYGSPGISPNGSTLYFGRGDALGDNLYSLNLANGVEEALSAEALPFGSGVYVSLAGHRLTYSHAVQEGTGVRLDGLELPSRRPFTHPSPGAGSHVWPLGARGVLDIAADFKSLIVLDSLEGNWRNLVAPDSLRLTAFAPAPDGLRAAVLVATSTAMVLGTTPLTKWDFRPIASWRFDSAEDSGEMLLALNWQGDGAIYFTSWRHSEETPGLYRISESGGPAVRVATIPTTCRLDHLSISLPGKLGACVAMDRRSDVWTIEGVGRQ
ncbi:MAG: protein kinase [Gemmatimonadales bacterium]